LKPYEQAAILFHESYWIFKPDATYLEVVSAEMAFQKFLEAKQVKKYHPALARIFSGLFGQHISLSMALTQDLKSGALVKLGAGKKGLPVAKLFRSGQVFCSYSMDRSWLMNASIYGDTDLAYIFQLQRQFPQSLFLNDLLEFMAPDRTGKVGGVVFTWERKGNEPAKNDCTTLPKWKLWAFDQIRLVIHEPVYKTEATTNRYIYIPLD